MCGKLTSSWPRHERRRARNGRPRGGVARNSRRSNVTFSRILCAPPSAAALRCVFSQKRHYRRRGVAKNFSLRHLKRDSRFFEPECAARPSQSLFCYNSACRCSAVRFNTKTTLSLQRCCRRNFCATPLRWECRFRAKAHRTAATASVFKPSKTSSSLQSGLFWAEKGGPAAEVLSSKILFNTSAVGLSLLVQNDCGCSQGPFFMPH